MEVAFGGVDAALEEVEAAVGVIEACGDELILVLGGAWVEGAVEEGGFGGGEAAEEPGAADEGVDQVSGFGGGWVEADVVFGLERFQIFTAFGEDDFGFGVDAGFEGVGGGALFAFGGDGAGGEFGVAAVGVDLFDGGHGGPPFWVARGGAENKKDPRAARRPLEGLPIQKVAVGSAAANHGAVEKSVSL